MNFIPGTILTYLVIITIFKNWSLTFWTDSESPKGVTLTHNHTPLICVPGALVHLLCVFIEVLLILDVFFQFFAGTEKSEIFRFNYAEFTKERVTACHSGSVLDIAFPQ